MKLCIATGIAQLVDNNDFWLERLRLFSKQFSSIDITCSGDGKVDDELVKDLDIRFINHQAALGRTSNRLADSAFVFINPSDTRMRFREHLSSYTNGLLERHLASFFNGFVNFLGYRREFQDDNLKNLDFAPCLDFSAHSQ